MTQAIEHRTQRHARMGRVGLVLLLLSLFPLSGCKTIDVNSDWDPAYDFGRLQTWKWSEESQMPTGNQTFDSDGLLSRRVQVAVAQNLAARGYVETETSQADFEVAWFFTVEDRTDVTTVNDYHGYGGARYGWYGGGYSTSHTMVDNYKQGTLIIDVKAGEPEQLVWRGSGTARLKEKNDPATAQARANEAVASILAQFPPPTKSGN